MNNYQSPPKVEQAYCTDIGLFLQTIHRPDDVFEVRSPDCPDRKNGTFKSTASGYFDDPSLAVAAVEKLDSLGSPAVYLTLNPVDPKLIARANNRIVFKAKSTTADSEIVHRRWIVIDIDSKRPAGISATDSEVAAALDLADSIRDQLQSIGWPDPVEGMSGNGGYLIYRVDLPNDDPSRDLIKAVLHGLAHRFDKLGATVDCSCFNASRIIKVLGTVARKGDSVNDRPHRRSCFRLPDGPLHIVPADLLREVGSWAACGDSTKSDSRKSSSSKSESTKSDSTKSDSTVLDRAEKYLAKMEPSVAGQKGHCRLLIAAGAMVRGFELSDSEAFDLLDRVFNPRCSPKWAAHEINHKISEARKKGKPFGYLLDSSSAKTDWDDPVEIDRPDLPEFPIEKFPSVLGRWILAVAHAYQTPVELGALLALSAISGTIQRRIEIQAGKDWIEPVNLFVACLLPPASRKSAVFAEALRPLRKIERELIKDSAPEIARAVQERKIREKELSSLESKAAKGCQESFEAAGKLAVELAMNPPPVKPKLIIDDTSPEAAEVALSEQSGRLIVAGAEGGLFDILAGRYSGSINIDLFLKSHSGDDLRVDRLSRESIFIEKPTLTLAYAVQPEVIRGLSDKPAFRGRGLIGRFLYAVPESNLGSRLIDADGVPPGLALEYELLFRRLMRLNCSLDDPSILVMAPNAYDLFIEFRSEVELMLADDGRLSSFPDWGGKLCGLVARLAAVLHVSRVESDPWNVPIDLVTIQAAIDIGRWAIPHAEAAIGLMKAGNTILDDACHCLRFVRSEAKSRVSRRDIHVHGRSRFDGDPVRLDACLDRLEDSGWIRPVDDPDRKRGRPSLVFDVHPNIWA